MEALQVKIILSILEHVNITSSFVGELALLYYNVPRVVHDIELCVPADLLTKAAATLCSTGLFTREDHVDFDVYTEYKRGCPRLCSTSWADPPRNIVIFPATAFGLDPLNQNIVPHKEEDGDVHHSPQITDLIPERQISELPWPCLPPFFSALCQKYLDTNDAMAMIAAEQLVDGMNLDRTWLDKNLFDVDAEVRRLADRLVEEKASRMDDFSSNLVTCFVANEEEARNLKKVPGYE